MNSGDESSQRTLEVSHRIYSYKSENDIILRVWPEFSQVGLAMWPSGWLVAEWILSNPEIFKGRSILELGSGVGLTGVVLEKFVKSKSVYLTDYLDSVLNNCRRNVEISNDE